MILGIILVIIVGGIAVFSSNSTPTNNDLASEGEIIDNSTPETNSLKITLSESLQVTTP